MSELSSIFEFGSAAEIWRDVAELVKPPKRIRVSEAAAKHCYVRMPNGNYDLWSPELTPYLIEPMDLLNDRRYDGVVLIGPSRGGKTQVYLGWMTYIIIYDPGDAQIIHTTQNLARDFSRREIDRTIRNSPDLLVRLSPRGHDDNTYDKVFRAGNILTISWPTIEQLSSRGMKYIASTDYDRRDKDDVNREGDLWGLMGKRLESYMSSGKRYLETSPGFPIKDPGWKPRADAPHEAPPCDGGLAMYNQGDRRRFYWPCQHCGEFFLAEWEHLKYDDALDDPMEAAKTVRAECPVCKQTMAPAERKRLNALGGWAREGEKILPDGSKVGEPRQSNIASFWFQGPTACFQTWPALVLDYLRAKQEYERTGSEESLKRTITQDLGRPYLPKSRDQRSYVELMERAEDLGQGVIPPGVRFIVAAVDVQHNRFVVQVEGFGVGNEHWYLDRFEITFSERVDDEGNAFPLNPPAYPEDWMLLIPKVLRKTYPLADGSGRHMRLRHVACDSGGKAGTTLRAYNFWRRLRARGLSSDFMLVKGEDHGPRLRVSYPNSGRKDRRAGARGEIPVNLLNVTLIKDNIFAGLDRTEPGPGYSHFPDHFPDSWFKELLNEVKDGGKYQKLPGPNESLDLAAYNRGNLAKIGGEEIDWRNPPRWARPWAENSLVFMPDGDPDDDQPLDEDDEVDGDDAGDDDWESLGKELG